jgi:hypothetical protein
VTGSILCRYWCSKGDLFVRSCASARRVCLGNWVSEESMAGAGAESTSLFGRLSM